MSSTDAPSPSSTSSPASAASTLLCTPLAATWVFASEIDPDAAAVYDHNWLRPLRESGARCPTASSRSGQRRHRPAHRPRVPVPTPTCSLPASRASRSPRAGSSAGWTRPGAPCSGTSPASSRTPSASLRGPARERAQPRWPAPPRHDLQDDRATLRELGYRTANEPAVFSPHLLRAASAVARRCVSGSSSWRTTWAGGGRRTLPTSTTRSSRPKPLDARLAQGPVGPREGPPAAAGLGGRPALPPRRSEVKMIQTWDRLLTAVAERLEPGREASRVPDLGRRVAFAGGGEDLIDGAAVKGTRSRRGRGTSSSRTPSSTTVTRGARPFR